MRNLFLAFLLIATSALAQEGVGGGGFTLNGPGENWNYQITVLGGSTGGGINSNDPTLSSATTLTGGENDIIISACLCTDTTAPATCTQSGPSGIANLSNQVTNGTGVGRFTVYYTVITNGNKGTGVTCTNPGSNSGGTTATQILLRGADPVNITDATTANATGSSTNPNPASITTVRDSAAVVIACGSVVSDTTPGDSTNYATATPGKQTLNQADTNPGTTTMTWRVVPAAAAEDPAAFSSWSTGTWACSTVALRPWGR